MERALSSAPVSMAVPSFPGRWHTHKSTHEPYLLFQLLASLLPPLERSASHDHLCAGFGQVQGRPAADSYINSPNFATKQSTGGNMLALFFLSSHRISEAWKMLLSFSEYHARRTCSAALLLRAGSCAERGHSTVAPTIAGNLKLRNPLHHREHDF